MIVCVCVWFQAEMALLMDDGEAHQHFNYDQIVEQQNLSKKRRKKLLKNNMLLEEDNFTVRDQTCSTFSNYLLNRARRW